MPPDTVTGHENELSAWTVVTAAQPVVSDSAPVDEPPVAGSDGVDPVAGALAGVDPLDAVAGAAGAVHVTVAEGAWDA
jgi:hypothetical protein